ncbi:MAG TPA: Hsp20/alpha crystallin family protein [Chloroflexota bacterium]|jgi:HSP20 family protein
MPESMVPVKATNGAAPRRAEPFAWLDDFAAEMERFWTRPFSFFTGPLPRPFFHLVGHETLAWAPRMDVYEKDHTIVVKAELPGLKKEDVQVEVEGDDLIIRGQTKAENEVKQENYYRTERTFGSFYRRMQLPAGVTSEQIQANLTDGVLEVLIAVPAEVKPETKTVPVN